MWQTEWSQLLFKGSLLYGAVFKLLLPQFNKMYLVVNTITWFSNIARGQLDF